MLKLVEMLNSKSKIRMMDETEDQLLNSIMIDDQAGRSVFVGDLLGLRLLGSQAKLHQRVKNLRSMGYIKLMTQDDARRKRVMPTAQAYKRFESLSKCIERAIK
jgi:DNA-binding MarR family transcriptional regulator